MGGLLHPLAQADVATCTASPWGPNDVVAVGYPVSSDHFLGNRAQAQGRQSSS